MAVLNPMALLFVPSVKTTATSSNNNGSRISGGGVGQRQPTESTNVNNNATQQSSSPPRIKSTQQPADGSRSAIHHQRISGNNNRKPGNKLVAANDYTNNLLPSQNVELERPVSTDDGQINNTNNVGSRAAAAAAATDNILGSNTQCNNDKNVKRRGKRLKQCQTVAILSLAACFISIFAFADLQLHLKPTIYSLDNPLSSSDCPWNDNLCDLLVAGNGVDKRFNSIAESSLSALENNGVEESNQESTGKHPALPNGETTLRGVMFSLVVIYGSIGLLVVDSFIRWVQWMTIGPLMHCIQIVQMMIGLLICLYQLVSRYKAVFILSLLIMCPLLVFGNNDEDDSDFDPGEDDYDGHGHNSFGAGYSRNDDQQSTYDSVLDYCLAFAKIMYENNELFIPLAGAWSYFIASNLPTLGDCKNSKVYLYGTSIDNLFKIGHAYNGRFRDAFYDKIGRHFAFTVFNLDIQYPENHASLVKTVLQFCRQFCAITPAQLFSLTLHDAFEYENSWLPFALGLFLYALGHSKEECPKMGGGIAIKGLLRRLILFFVESGVQMLCAKLGIALSDASQAHEWLCGSLDWVAKAHFRCCNMVDKFWEAMQTIDTSGDDPRVWKFYSAYFGYYSSYLDTITAQSIPVFAMSTWKPGIPDGTIIFLTPLLMNLIFSYLGGREDAFGDVTPPAHDPYNAGSFKPHQRITARERIYKWLDTLQINIMFGALDVNDAAFEGSNNSAKAELHRRGWKVLIDFNQFGYDIIVYFFQLEVGYWPSIIFLHRPPCFMANTDMQTALDEWLAKVKHYQTRAEEMYIIFLICRLLQKPSTSFEAERRFRFIPVFGNILVAHSVFVSLVQNLQRPSISFLVILSTLTFLKHHLDTALSLSHL